MSRWVGHFGLRETPFTKDIGATDLWVPKSRAPVIERLVDACRERGHAVLAGEPGVGKTCVLRALRQRLPARLPPDLLPQRHPRPPRLLPAALPRARPVPEATAAAVFYVISSHVEELGRENVHPVFLLDEAHLLHQDVLDHLHILLNYEWDSRPCSRSCSSACRSSGSASRSRGTARSTRGCTHDYRSWRRRRLTPPSTSPTG